MNGRVVNITAVLIALICVNTNVQNVDSVNILAIFNIPSKSHWILIQPLLRELALDGHNVTLISPYDPVDPPQNYTNILLKGGGVFDTFARFAETAFDETDVNPLIALLEVFSSQIAMGNATLAQPQVQALIKSDMKFDLIIMEIIMNELMMGFSGRFNCPIIGVSTIGGNKWTNELTGSPGPLSYVPNPFTSLTDKMNFFQRFSNVMHTIFLEFLLSFNYESELEAVYNLHFPDPKPTLREIRNKGVAVMFLNSHFSISFPRPYLPNLIEVAGVHVNTKVQPLPQNIKTFIEESKDGVIFFSLGSNVKPSKMPASKREDIIRALSKRKERVIWKWDNPNIVVDKSKIMVGSWFPQDDILAHPNVKLFITHGGLLSCTESIYHGKAVIGIPVFGDQQLNMAQVTSAGWGLQIDYTNLTEASLSWALNEIFSNNIYAENAKEISELFRDQPHTPLETAKYWVEYVLRHKGAPHLRSTALDLNFIQYHNLDVFGTIALVVYILIKIITYVIVFICRKFTKRNDKVKIN